MREFPSNVLSMISEIYTDKKLLFLSLPTSIAKIFTPTPAIVTFHKLNLSRYTEVFGRLYNRASINYN